MELVWESVGMSVDRERSKLRASPWSSSISSCGRKEDPVNTKEWLEMQEHRANVVPQTSGKGVFQARGRERLCQKQLRG